MRRAASAGPLACLQQGAADGIQPLVGGAGDGAELILPSTGMLTTRSLGRDPGHGLVDPGQD